MVIILCPPPKKYLVITFKFIVQMNLFTKRENGKGKWFRHPYVRRNCLKYPQRVSRFSLSAKFSNGNYPVL